MEVAMENKRYKKGEVIFNQGDIATSMFDITWGTVGIFSDYNTPHEKKISEIRTGESFGEMGLIEYRPRSATAVALENDTRIKEVTPDDFASYFKEKPGKILTIMGQLSSRLRKTTADYIDACRTISELSECENKPKSSSLASRVKKFIDIYKEST